MYIYNLYTRDESKLFQILTFDRDNEDYDFPSAIQEKVNKFSKTLFSCPRRWKSKNSFKTLWKDTQVEDRQINGDYFYTNCFNQMSKKMDLLIVNLVTLEQTFIDYYNFDSLLRLEYNKL